MEIYNYLIQYFYPEHVLLVLVFTEFIKVYVPRTAKIFDPKWITLFVAVVIGAVLFIAKTVNGTSVDHLRTALSLGASTVIYDYTYKPLKDMIIRNKEAIMDFVKQRFNLK